MQIMPKVGTILGRFRLEAELGQGGMGTVYLAHDTLLDTKVALKVLSPALAKTEMLNRLSREVLMARKVSHPGICRIFDIHEVNQYLFISMEYVDGPSLEDLLKQHGSLPIERAGRIIGNVARALHAAHTQGIIHRGLTPSNIIVRKSDRVSILDFGLAKARDMAGSTGTGAPLESIHYTSPEVLTAQPATQASDIYSLGVMLYRCVTGAVPFQGVNVVDVTNAILSGNLVAPHLFNPDVKQSLEKLILKAMALSVEERFAKVGEFGDWLAAVVGDDENASYDSEAEMAAFLMQADIDQGSSESEGDPSEGHTQQIHMRHATLLFSDIVGITPYFEKFGDMAGRKRIQKHNEVLFPIIQRHRGQVIKTIGDAIMAHFPTPDRGVEASMEMQQALEKLNQATRDVDARIYIRIGLHSGQCIIEKQDVFGDAVNVAARVSALAESRQILISEDTREGLVRNLDHTSFATKTNLKGKTEEVDLYFVKWEGKEVVPATGEDEQVATLVERKVPERLRKLDVPEPIDPLSMPSPPVDGPFEGAEEPTAEEEGIAYPPDLSAGSSSEVESPARPDSNPPSSDTLLAQALYVPEVEDDPEDTGVGLAEMTTEGTSESAVIVSPLEPARPARAKALDLNPMPPLMDSVAPPMKRRKSRRGLVIGLLAFLILGGVGLAVALNLDSILAPADPDQGAGGSNDPRPMAGAPDAGRDEGVAEPDAPDAGAVEVAVGVDAGPTQVDEPPVDSPDAGQAVDPPPADDKPQPPRVATLSPRAEFDRFKRSLRSAQRKKGLIHGDVPALDVELSQMNRLAKQGKYPAALSAGRKAQGLLKDVEVDRTFIKAKLTRFNRAFDAAGDNPATEKVLDLGQDIMSAVEEGQYAKANSLLNRSFQLLRNKP